MISLCLSFKKIQEDQCKLKYLRKLNLVKFQNLRVPKFDVSQTFKCYIWTQRTWENGKKCPHVDIEKINVF